MKNFLVQKIKFAFPLSLFFLLSITATFAIQRNLDFDGDGQTDYTVVRVEQFCPRTDGQECLPEEIIYIKKWYILRSSDSAFTATIFGNGNSYDSPVPKDYDGDGKTDIAVFRDCHNIPTNCLSTFYVYNSSNGFLSYYYIQTGNPNYTEDYDGDGKADPTVVGQQYGYDYEWHYLSSANNYNLVTFQPATFTNPSGEHPLVGDFDGDGKADAAILYNTANSGLGLFFKESSTNQSKVISGIYGVYYIPILADFDGDSKTDIATRTHNSTTYDIADWSIKYSSDNYNYASPVAFGYFIDYSHVGYWDGDNKADIGVIRNGGNPYGKYFYSLGSLSGFKGVQWGLPNDFDFNDDLYY